MHEIRNYVNIINESWIDDLSIEDLRSLAGRSDNRTSPIINPNNVIVDGNVTLDNIQRTSDSEEFTAVANGFGSSEGSEDYDIDVKDIQVDIKIEAFGSVQEGEFKIVSVTGDGMNFVHEDGNWGDYTDAFVNAMQTEAVEEDSSPTTNKVFFKVINTQGTGMPSGFNRVKTIRSLEDGGFYIELSKPGYGMDYTMHNYKNFELKDASGRPITGKEANDIINKKEPMKKAVEEEKKNCGCGKDPCETYGKTDVEEAMGPMAKVNDEGQIEMTKSDYSKIHRDYKTKIDGTYMALRLDHKTGGTVLTPVTFIDAVAEGEEVRSEEKDTDNMKNSMNEGKVKSQMIDDSETMSKADFIKKYDQENADDLYEVYEATKKVCKDCGDEIHKPTTDCKHDCDDEMGENWVAESSKLDESPTMDTTQLVSMLHLAGLSEEAIERKITEWANSPEGCSETSPTSHGDPYDYAQPVNLSLKRYMDAEDKKVSISEHTIDSMKSLYEESKKKTMVEAPNEGNEFSGNRKKAMDAGEDEFEVDGKKYKVKESASGSELAEAQSAAQKAAFKKMLDKKEPTMDDEPEYDGDKKEPSVEESLEESKELAILLRNAGL